MRNYGRPAHTALLVFVVSATLLFTSSCGSSTPHNAYAYVIQDSPAVPIGSEQITGGITQLRVANDGTLTQIGPANLGSISRPYGMLVHPSGRYLFLTSNDGNTYEFMIRSDGTIAANPAGTIKPLAAGDGIAPVGYTPDGRFVITTSVNFTGNNPTVVSYTVSSYELSSSGVPTLINTLSMNGNPSSIAIDTSGRFLYSSSYGSNSISKYMISESGALAFVGTTRNNQSSGYDCYVTISPKDFLYCGNNGGYLETTISLSIVKPEI